VISQAVVVATGVCGDGRREVLGFAVGDSEDGAFWTAFLRSLKARGLTGVQLVIADAHLGLRHAVQAVLAGAAVQRCRVHFLERLSKEIKRRTDAYTTPRDVTAAPAANLTGDRLRKRLLALRRQGRDDRMGQRRRRPPPGLCQW
jgi:putative transposase